MALPYTVSMTITGLLAVYLFLQSVTQSNYAQGLLSHHVPATAGISRGHAVPAVSLTGSVVP